MPPQDTSFIQKLRMNNIFPSGPVFGGEGGELDIPSLMGNVYDFVQRGKEADLQRQLNLDLEMRNRERQDIFDRINRPGLYGIAQQMQQGVQEQPTNVRLQENRITPYQQAQLELSRERLGQTGRLGEERIETTRRGQDVQIRRAELAEKIASGRATDEEKHEYRMTEIGARGDIQEELAGTRGEQALKQIGARLAGQKELTGVRGEQRLGEIAERARLTGLKPESQTQIRARQENTARELVNTRPDLAKYIETDPYTGKFIRVKEPGTRGGPSETEFNMINQAIFGKSTGDIELPTETIKKTPITKTPTVTTPTSKYKVTVE